MSQHEKEFGHMGGELSLVAFSRINMRGEYTLEKAKGSIKSTNGNTVFMPPVNLLIAQEMGNLKTLLFRHVRIEGIIPFVGTWDI